MVLRNRPEKRVMGFKTAKRLQMPKAEGERRYAKFVEPIMPILEKMAERYARKKPYVKKASPWDKKPSEKNSLHDQMISEAVIHIMTAAGMPSVRKTRHYFLRTAKNAMRNILRQEKYERKLAQTRSFEMFLKMVDKRAKVEMPEQGVFNVVGNILKKIGIDEKSKKTFAYRYKIRESYVYSDRSPRTLEQTAKHLGENVSIVKSRISRVKTKLREYIERHELELTP